MRKSNKKGRKKNAPHNKCEWRVEPFDRTFDFNLSAEKDRCRTADFQRDLGFLEIVLNVGGVAGRNGRSMVVRCARLCVAFLCGRRLHARTQFVATFHFVLLCHNLLAFDLSLLDATAARSAKYTHTRREKMNNFVTLTTRPTYIEFGTRTCYISTIPILPIAPDNRVCCSIDAAMVAAVDTSYSAQPLYFHRRASPRECIELHVRAHQCRMISSTASNRNNSIVADTVDRCMCECVPPASFRANTKTATTLCRCLRARNL